VYRKIEVIDDIKGFKIATTGIVNISVSTDVIIVNVVVFMQFECVYILISTLTHPCIV